VVTCLEGTPQVTYDVYLPPGYSATGTPLPILYTMHPNGGGMVGYFSNVCASLHVICIGVVNSANTASADTVFQSFYEISRDVRRRVNFDPTAEFAAGFSGGGDSSYDFARMRAQHMSGVLPLAGWLGRVGGAYEPTYYSTDRVQTNLLVARVTGNSDPDVYYLPYDSNYLVSCGAVIQDWYFSGGHDINSPESVKSAALTWLLNNRIPAGPADQTNAVIQAASWRSRLVAGQTNAVLRECVAALMNQPRTWMALEAELVMDDIAFSATPFRPVVVTNLAQGDFASDLFYWQALGAGDSSITSRYKSFMKMLAAVGGTSGDRAGDIYSLLTRFGYPAPILLCSRDQYPGQAFLAIREDAPGLTYSAQVRTNLATDAWQDIALPYLDTNGLWSAAIEGQPGGSGCYRVGATPTPGTSPPPHL